MLERYRFASLMTAWALALSPAAPSPAAQGAAVAKAIEISGVKGGLVVHIGCGDGKLTAALRANNSFLVHGLDTQAENVAKARRHIRSLGLYGPVSIDRWTTAPRLPYADNLVNLVVAENLSTVPMAEVMRVLCPGGVAYVGGQKTVKPRPSRIDDWTHTLYDATNNAVAADTVVAPPHHVQWVAGPRNARHHERLASVTAVVSAGGRLFAIIDEAPAASVLLPPKWFLVARDAFNGVALWKRPIRLWHPHLHPFRQGPPALARRLVATERRVYVTLGLRAPVTALDAATGRTVTTYKGTQGAEEILHQDGVLYLVATPAAAPRTTISGLRDKTVMAIDAAGGDVLWRKPNLRILPSALTVAGGRVFFMDDRGLVALDAKTGREVWRAGRKVALNRPKWSAPTVVAHDDVVLCADRQADPASNLDESTGKRIAAWLAREGYPGDLVAYSTGTGKELWRCRSAEAYHAPIDVFVVNGVVWYGQSRSRTGPDFTTGRDLHTGKIVRRIRPDKAFKTTMPHHRCHRNRATSRYILAGRTGVEFIDLAGGQGLRHHWVRGTCQFGTLPCNGLLYAPPHSCACYIEAKLAGFYALAPKGTSKIEGQPLTPAGSVPRGTGNQTSKATQLEKGPAFGQINRQSSIVNRQSDDWCTYRHDGARTGFTRTPVPANLKRAWAMKVGPRLSSPVVAGGKVLVASIDTHTVHVLDATSGAEVWSFTAGGRVDSPPSVAQGLAVFGSADGRVTCLRLADGELVWRFRPAPTPRRIVAFGQVESTWPVHGSVLIRGSVVTFAAGRSSYLDGGLILYRLDLKTGRELSRRGLYSRDPDTGGQPGEPISFEMPGAMPDVLSGDDGRVYMRRLAFDARTLQPAKSRPHLYSPAGFLNGDWWHRTYWIYGEHFYSGYIGWYFAGRENPAGRLLTVTDEAIYGYGYKPTSYRGATGRAYHLFATDRASLAAAPPTDYRRANRDYASRARGKFRITFAWQKDVPLRVRAMVAAADTLFVAGPPDLVDEPLSYKTYDQPATQAKLARQAEALNGAAGGMLWAVSRSNGGKLAELKLTGVPVHDGLAAANRRLYMATLDGRVLCYEGKK